MVTQLILVFVPLGTRVSIPSVTSTVTVPVLNGAEPVGVKGAKALCPSTDTECVESR